LTTNIVSKQKYFTSKPQNQKQKEQRDEGEERRRKKTE
jgi:hypothetical protein